MITADSGQNYIKAARTSIFFLFFFISLIMI
jgi:hypothetical protein